MSIATRGRLLAALPLLAVLLLPACIKSEQTTNIAADGSGQASLKISVDNEKMKQLEEMMKGMMPEGGESGSSNPMDEMKPETLKKVAKDNEKIRIISVETLKDPLTGNETHEAKFEFDSLEAFYTSGLMTGGNAKLEKLEDGNYRFTFEMSAGDQDMPETPEMEQQLEMIMGMMEPFLGDMQINNTVVLPTPIIETNGERGVGNAVTWKLGFKDIPKASKRRQVVTFSGEGLDWKPFTVTAKDMQKARTEALEAADAPATTPTEEPAGAGAR